MSLAADDAEIEQNELRNLHLQLAHTNELVETLSRQLNELKEQVGNCLWSTSFEIREEFVQIQSMEFESVIVITGPPNGQLLFCSLVSVVVCWGL